MKHFYDINKWLIIITLLLYFTFWGGIIAQVILGAVQILMSIFIIIRFYSMPKTVKTSFVTYVVLTISTIAMFKIITSNGDQGFASLFFFMILTMLLALFHLYITYKIKQL